MQELAYLPDDLFTIIQRDLHCQVWSLWQIGSLFIQTSAWQVVFIAFNDTFGYY